MKNIQEALDIANIVNYSSPIIVKGNRPSDEDVPKEYIKDCQRIMRIVEEYSNGETIKLCMAYDLWSIHSQESFCGSWECMEGVSDAVIYHNLIGLMQWLKFED